MGRSQAKLQQGGALLCSLLKRWSGGETRGEEGGATKRLTRVLKMWCLRNFYTKIRKRDRTTQKGGSRAVAFNFSLPGPRPLFLRFRPAMLDVPCVCLLPRLVHVAQRQPGWLGLCLRPMPTPVKQKQALSGHILHAPPALLCPGYRLGRRRRGPFVSVRPNLTSRHDITIPTSLCSQPQSIPCPTDRKTVVPGNLQLHTSRVARAFPPGQRLRRN